MSEQPTRRLAMIRSIRTRLAAIFFLFTALALGVVYVVVAPPLTSSLQSQKIKDLEPVARQALPQFEQLQLGPPTDPPTSSVKRAAATWAQKAALETASNVIVFDVELSGNSASTPQAYVVAASDGAPEGHAITEFAGAVAVGGAPHAAIPGDAGQLGVVGLADPSTTSGNLKRVVVFSVKLHDVAPTVSLVRSRILEAAAIALLVALVIGVLVARALTVRVLRLERVAQRVAQGDFSAHFSDPSRDELGQLAAALAHMQSQLEGLESARRRFIATASHELRTPIFSLGGFLELIQDEDLDEETRTQFVGQVREQVDRLGKLATQLLDLSRLESGSVQLTRTIADLGVLSRAVSAEFLPALAAHDSQLELRLPNEPIRALCDSERVAQLLRILIDNAITHTGPGTAVIVEAVRGTRNAGPRLSVRDEGGGIAEDARERIFEPFYSADGVRGAGLGLAIARELAVQMGARLEVESAPGETTFTLILAAGSG